MDPVSTMEYVHFSKRYITYVRETVKLADKNDLACIVAVAFQTFQ